jgi:MFS family permease
MRPASNITKFYIWKALEGCKFIYAIRVIYLIGKGITAPQLALSASMAMVTSIALEIPTGFIADRFSRKLSVSLGFAAQGLSFLTLIYAHDLITLIPASVLLGLGSSLLSGSAASLLFDELKQDNHQATFLRISSRGTSVATISGAMATFVGPLIFVAHRELPFILTGAVYMFLALFVLTITEPSPSRRGRRSLALLDGIHNVLHLRPILLITLIDALLLIFSNIFYNVLYFPKINALGFPTRYLGALDAFNLLLMAGMLVLLPRLCFKSDKTTVIFYTMLPAVVFVMFGNSAALFPAVLFGVSFDLAYAARLHVIPSITNQFLSSENRALSLSSMSFVSKLAAAILLPIATLIFTSSYWYTIVPVVLIALLLMLYPSHKGAGYPAL